MKIKIHLVVFLVLLIFIGCGGNKNLAIETAVELYLKGTSKKGIFCL